DDVLARIELAAQAVELAEVQVGRVGVAVDEEDAAAVRGEHVTQRREDRRVRHPRLLHARGLPPFGDDLPALLPNPPLHAFAALHAAFECLEQFFPHVAGRLGPLFPDPATLAATVKRPPAGEPLGLDEPALARVWVSIIPFNVHTGTQTDWSLWRQDSDRAEVPLRIGMPVPRPATRPAAVP